MELLWRSEDMDVHDDPNVVNGKIAGAVNGAAIIFAIVAYLDILNIYEVDPAFFMPILYTITSLLFANTISAVITKQKEYPKDVTIGTITVVLTSLGAFAYIELGFQREIQILTFVVLSLYAGYSNIYYADRLWSKASSIFFFAVILSVAVAAEFFVFLSFESEILSSSGRVIAAYLALMSTYGFSNCNWKYARPIWIASLAFLVLYSVLFLVFVSF